LAIIFIASGTLLLLPVVRLSVPDTRLMLQAGAMGITCGLIARVMVVEARRRRRAS